MKRKAIIASLLAAMMIGSTAFSLVGCGSETPDSTVSQSDTSTANTISEHKTVLYVTGTDSTIAVRQEMNNDSTIVANLKAGDAVNFISSDSAEYWYVEVPSNQAKGYIRKEYLTEEKNAVTKGTLYFIKSKTNLYSSNDSDHTKLTSLSKNAKVNVIAKTSGDYWFVYAQKDKIFGYVKTDKLSTSKVATTSSSNSSASTSSAPTNTVIVQTPVYPSHYANDEKWYVHVDTGFLALRTAQEYDDSNIIGKLYNGDYVYVEYYEHYSDTYWYVYSPSLGMYGYVNSNYIYN